MGRYDINLDCKRVDVDKYNLTFSNQSMNEYELLVLDHNPVQLEPYDGKKIMQKKIAASKENGQLKITKASVSWRGRASDNDRAVYIRICGDNKKGIWSSDYYFLFAKYY